MAKAIKFEIIRKWPEVRGIDVHFYTSELLAAVLPTWGREAMWMRANTIMSEAEIGEKLRRNWPAGRVLFLTLPKTIATREELIVWILNRAPYEDMMTREECLIALPDMTLVDELIATPAAERVPSRVELAEAEAAEAQIALLVEPPIPIL